MGIDFKDMKIRCIIGQFSPNQELCFSHQHIYLSLKKYADCYTGPLQEDTTHVLFIDGIENVISMKSEVLLMKEKGIKVISAFYDEPRFKIADVCIEQNLVDKLILFDKQYKERFDFSVYISDYFVNEDLFPQQLESHNENTCYFGHLLYNRVMPSGCNKITDNTNYINFYNIIKEYNGCVVFDTGRSEDSDKVIVHSNKAKVLEALMCGVNAYCQSGVKTKNYDRFLKPFTSGALDINPVEFKQEEIREINKSVIIEFLNECKNA
jgi:hypothetical protein